MWMSAYRRIGNSDEVTSHSKVHWAAVSLRPLSDRNGLHEFHFSGLLPLFAQTMEVAVEI